MPNLRVFIVKQNPLRPIFQSILCETEDNYLNSLINLFNKYNMGKNNSIYHKNNKVNTTIVDTLKVDVFISTISS